jgi:enoyl-CoA hydratase
MAVVEFEVEEHIARLTINRPKARNAMSPEVMVRLHDAWQEVRDSAAIRVAILTATGDKAFCSGADLALTAPLVTGARQVEDEWDERLLQILASDDGLFLINRDTVKPVIAAINGHAIAGGMELVFGCDIRVTVPDAKFGLQEVKWGLFPAGASTVRLPRQIPHAIAMELLLTGDLITAQRAHALGFVNHVVDASALMPTALGIARKIADNGPLAVSAIRRSARDCVGQTEAQALDTEAALAKSVIDSQDAIEGPRAFMEKRKPVFRGR